MSIIATTTITISEPITAENVVELFPDVDTQLVRDLDASQTSAREGGELEGYDEEQIKLMDERCIVLDEDDKPIGSATKKTCTFFCAFPIR